MSQFFKKSRTALFLTAAVLSIVGTSCAPAKKTTEKNITKMMRIASMAPSSTTILSGLGLAPSIVAIDTWSAGIPGVPPNTPQFDMMKPDIEKLAETASDLMLVSSITQEGTSKDPFKPLAEAGVQVVYIPTSNSINDIRADIRRIAILTGRSTEGEKLISVMDKEIERIRSIVKTIPAEKRRSAMFEISSAPSIYSFGKGVFLHELLETAGVRNVLEAETGWIAVSAETVVKSDPDVILTNVNYLPDPIAEILGRPGWDGMKAVREKRVYVIDNASSSQPSQNVVKALQTIAEAVYPEYFK